MLLKPSYRTEVELTDEGHIRITQESIEHGKDVDVFLTVAQLGDIWAAFDGLADAIDAWNGGIEE